MKTEQARVNLPGEMYRKGERWWWKVRLPGERRLRARSLRPLGEQQGTTSRRVAEEVALAMWEDAVAQCSRDEAAAARGLSALQRAETHARLHQPRDGSSTDGEGLQPPAPEDDLSDFPSPTFDIDLSNGGDLFNIASTLFAKAGPGIGDQARCECCGCTDFFEEYLLPIDSGQQLCPRCLRAFQEKVAHLERQETLSNSATM